MITKSSPVLVLLLTFSIATGEIVDECPGREVPSLRQEAADSELALVFYYSSWNKDSVAARDVYIEVANYYDGYCYFAAVDCWHLHCNCSHTHQPLSASAFGTPHKWPTLMVDYGRGAVHMQYHGEWSFAALAGYMDNLLVPVQRVHQKLELRQLLARCDAIVLGLFPSLQTAHYQRQFRRFTIAALEWLQTDPERNVRFTGAYGAAARDVVSTSDTSVNASLTQPQVLLISRGGIEAFNYSSGGVLSSELWDVQQLVFWVQTELRRSYAYIYGNSEPAMLAMRLKHGHVLAILAQDDALYNVVAGVISGFESADTKFHACERFWNHAKETLNYQWSMHIQTHTIPSTTQHSQQCLINEQNTLQAHNLWQYYVVNTWLSQRFQQLHTADSAAAEDPFNSEYSAERLLALHRYRACLRHSHYFSQELRIATAKYLKKSIDHQSFDNAAGTNLHHRHQNRTLSVVILDVEKYADYQFHTRGSMALHRAAASAFIIDPRSEHIYTMQERFGYDALMRFVRHYTDGHPVVRHVSTSLHQTAPTAPNALFLHNYNRQLFVQAVQHPYYRFNASNVVVLFYSPECGFCGMFAQTLLQVAAFLNTKSVHFVRINTLANDLPWEFVMPVTPALLVFPRGRFPESRIFPQRLQLNVRNVLGFILAQLEPTEQVRVVLDSCKQRTTLECQTRCLQFAKALVAQHIGTNLKYWQIFEDERNLILDRLKQFNDLTLDVQRTFRIE